MKKSNTLRRRGLALFLALVMCVSLLPGTALAEGTGGEENPAKKYAEVNKTARRTAADKWEITMTVKAKEAPIQSEPMELVLLLDTSGSMAWCTGNAHEHKNSCYKLTCEKAEIQHTYDCYKPGNHGRWKLDCKNPEHHVHDRETCYTLVCNEVAHAHWGGTPCQVVEDGAQSRIAIAGEKAQELIRTLSGQNLNLSVSVVTFASNEEWVANSAEHWGGHYETVNAHVQQEMAKLNNDNLGNIINAIPTSGAVGGTPMGAGLETAAAQFTPDTKARKVIIMLADGDNDGEIDPDGIANGENGLKKAGIEIFTIGFTTGIELLQKIASGDDHYYTADDAVTLASVFNKVAAMLSTMVTDNMGNHVAILKDSESQSGTNKGTVKRTDSKNLKWDAEKNTLTPEQGEQTITYTVEADFSGLNEPGTGKTIQLNDDATLNFMVNNQRYSLPFPVPTDTIDYGTLDQFFVTVDENGSVNKTLADSTHTGEIKWKDSAGTVHGATYSNVTAPAAPITKDGTTYYYVKSVYVDANGNERTDAGAVDFNNIPNNCDAKYIRHIYTSAPITVTKEPTRAGTWKEGEPVTWNITVTNNSSSQNFTNLSITDTLMRGDVKVEGVTVKDSSGADVATFNLSANTSLTFTATLPANLATVGTYKNAVVVKDIDNKEYPGTSPDVDVVPNVTVVKTPRSTTVAVGEKVVWDITVTNNGTTEVSGLSLVDILSKKGEGDTYTKVENPNMSIVGPKIGDTETTVSHMNFSLPAKSTSDPTDTSNSVTFTATLTGAAAGDYHNKVEVWKDKTNEGGTKLGEDDTSKQVNEDNTPKPPVTVSDRNISVTKSPDAPTDGVSWKAGDTVTWTITVKNNGQAKVTGLKVEDTYVTNMPGGNVTVKNGSVTLDENDCFALDAGAEATFTASMPNATAGKYTNSVVVKKGDEDVRTGTSTEVTVNALVDAIWIDDFNSNIIKTDRIVLGTTPERTSYPEAPTHENYIFTGWGDPVTDATTGNVTIRAYYVDARGPRPEDIRSLLKVLVNCRTNATHDPFTSPVEYDPAIPGGYNSSRIGETNQWTVTIRPDVYVAAFNATYGGDHTQVSVAPNPPSFTLEYVMAARPVTPAPEETGTGEADASIGGEELSLGIEPYADPAADPVVPSFTGYWRLVPKDASNTTTITVECERTHNVTWVNWDGTQLQQRTGVKESVLVPASDYTGTTPVRTSTDPFVTYTFTGWSDGVADAAGNITYTAQYSEGAVPSHTVTWLDWNGTPLYQVRIANTASEPGYPYGTPTRTSDGTYTYTFAGWTGPVYDAAGNVTYTAQYTPTAIPRTHTVTWVNWDGTVLQRELDVPAGTTPSYTGTLPTRPADAAYTYAFSNWSAPATDADGNVTYTAQYTPTAITTGPVTPINPVTPVTPNPGTTIPDTPTPLGPTPGTNIEDEDVPLAAPGLNSVDHFDYVKGYGDGLVKPEANITRAEVATIFFRLMTNEFRTENWATENTFTDVKAGDWYNNAISTAAKAGILNGYADSSFQPNKDITRAEFAAIAARFASDVVPSGGMFSDIEGHWAQESIERASAAGWIRGSDGKFRPEDKITRAEAITLINRMLDRVPDADHMLPDMITFTDNTPDKWYYADVQEAANSHDYDRDEIGVTEIWTAILPAQDWTALEKEWATAASAPAASVAPSESGDGTAPEAGGEDTTGSGEN